MEYKAIIFDLDGTVVHTDTIWIQATIALIAARGIVLTPKMKLELRNKLDGVSLPQACWILKHTLNLSDSVDLLIEEKKKRAFEVYDQGISYIEGFTDFYQKTITLRLKTALATNANPETVERTDKMLDLKQFFGNHMYNLSHVKAGKPEPDIYLLAAQQIEIDPTQCIAIEDSTHGIRAAKAAGMYCIGIDTGNKLKGNPDADLVVHHYEDIDLDQLIS